MDPYITLGVDRGASTEEVKAAYRALATKYHPDKYVGNDLADLAQEKMKQINEAYDTIVRERENGGGSGGYSGYSGPRQQQGGSTGAYAQVRSLISAGRLDEAESLLSGQAKTAEWYFLMGSIAYRRGWFDEAQANWRNAVQMDPGNAEYAQSYRYASQEPVHRTASYRGSAGDNLQRDLCSCCSTLMCIDCLCGCCR